MTSLVISNFSTGLKTNREPFLIDNDSFPVLNNAYVWRGRVMRKRGNSILGRLQREVFDVFILAYSTIEGINEIDLNFLFDLELDASILPKTLEIIFSSPINQTLVDLLGTGILNVSGSGPILLAEINYSTNIITITSSNVEGPSDSYINFSYHPNLPVMGLETFNNETTKIANLIAFDTKYSYEIFPSSDVFYDVTAFKNSNIEFNFYGQNYQQFWSTNYEGALWVTNGNPGFHFVTIEALDNQISTLDLIVSLSRDDLVVEDVLFFNEVQGTEIVNLNNRTGIIVENSLAPIYTVRFLNNITIADWAAQTGIVQTLTNYNPLNLEDGIRWYDGDPTTSFPSINGWVNFMPPLSTFRDGEDPFPNLHPDYLAGAEIILPFKNRLLCYNITVARFLSLGNYELINYKNRIVYSQVGTPFYTASGPSEPILVPTNKVSDPLAWSNDIGKGGFISAPISQKIITVVDGTDVQFIGLEKVKMTLVSTGNDSLPFIFQTTESEMGSSSTFSGIHLNGGVFSLSEYGIVIATPTELQRLDLAIPDQVFDIRKQNNDSKRVTSIRDFRNEWIYLTYCPSSRGTGEEIISAIYPSKTLLFNYQEKSWALLDENYTTYGEFQKSTNLIWADVGEKYGTWANWTDPLNFGSSSENYTSIIGGNQHGFVLIRDSGTFQAKSQYIKDLDISDPSKPIVLSPNHCLNSNEFLEIQEAIGVKNVNFVIFQIQIIDKDLFRLVLNDEQIDLQPSGTYLGGGVYRRLSRPNIQTKQFNLFFEEGRQTRIGTQKFFFSSTTNGEVTINISVDQSGGFSVNDPINSPYLMASNIVFTRTEQNLGFGYASNPKQMWHRLTNSFYGDTVQIGITLTDEQMKNNEINSAEIELHAIELQIYKGPLLR